MPIPLQCPACATKLNAPDGAAGKRVRCPQCAKPVPVPAADDDDGFEAVDDTPPVKAKTKSAEVRKAATRDEDDDDDRPRRKKPRAEDDDEAERPKSRRRRGDDEDDRPRKKSKKAAAKKKGPPLALLIGGGVGALAVVGVILFFALGGRATGPGGALGPATPPGFTAFRESGIGFAAFLPGQFVGDYVRQGQGGPPNPNFWAGRSHSGKHESALSALRKPGYKPGSGADELAGYLEKEGFFLNLPQKYDVTAREPVTLGGKPGLKVTLKEKANTWDKDADDAEFFKDSNQRERERVQNEGRNGVVYIVPSGEWLYMVFVSAKGGDPDAEVLKTVADSIKID